MGKKIKVINHGKEWIDPAPIILCPECGCEHLQEDRSFYHYHAIAGIELIKITEIRQCKECKCKFEIDYQYRFQIDWTDLFGTIVLLGIASMIALVLLLQGYETLPAWGDISIFVSTAAIVIGTIGFLISD